MILTTPFHERTSALNATGLWTHWSGYLAADRYQMSDKFEYFAVRNAAGVFDSSPLYKYRIHGRDALRFLEVRQRLAQDEVIDQRGREEQPDQQRDERQRSR